MFSIGLLFHLTGIEDIVVVEQQSSNQQETHFGQGWYIALYTLTEKETVHRQEVAKNNSQDSR